MLNYDDMSLSRVIEFVGDAILDALVQQDYEVEHPDRSIASILAVVDKANDYAASDSLVGFAVASSFLIVLVNTLKVELPKGLENRLHGRVIGS